uniref:Uncharacterized protein n=1 Tax=Chromera velia CCMP2878 TaxID=1169474 RepID=A0A0G4HTI0_9ALVE|mmetsp:Transcript_10661/g.20666  ORF Transcript_10661/g.20666 Transcript_10661/m.20666 type:complete len:115 (-) Transcript_10661:1287-1631(-)|eukprot:Cvel_31343.t1-p1 / transcript=Cvel_31343.t1 / gene=Cvel_31343 / organism=Chromera_velia_CCMP2878 / gene_product=hypothetical protein / transcript_product=hypothetical protein / location=Cvel_scaffold4654:2030-3010(+) / protein_length=114 / sequence_SO=supercontig / SO=protein_coding / is_pseudo=false
MIGIFERSIPEYKLVAFAEEDVVLLEHRASRTLFAGYLWNVDVSDPKVKTFFEKEVQGWQVRNGSPFFAHTPPLGSCIGAWRQRGKLESVLIYTHKIYEGNLQLPFWKGAENVD